jgi:amidase
VFGLKPTAHRFAQSGHIPPLPGAVWPDRQMMTVGPIARCVEDLALVAALLAGPDGRATDVPPVPWVPAPAREPGQLRIAFLTHFPEVPTARAVRAAVQDVARRLEAAGAQVEERDPGVPISQIKALWADYFPLVSAALQELSAPAMPVAAAGATAPSMANWARVQDRLDQVVVAMDALLSDFDAFLCPCVIAPAFEHSAPRSPFPVDGELVESRFVDHYLFPFNMTGHPAVALPAALADGLPIGVQLVGRRWGDERLLATAGAVVSVIGGFRAPPEPA